MKANCASWDCGWFIIHYFPRRMWQFVLLEQGNSLRKSSLVPQFSSITSMFMKPYKNKAKWTFQLLLELDISLGLGFGWWTKFKRFTLLSIRVHGEQYCNFPSYQFLVFVFNSTYWEQSFLLIPKPVPWACLLWQLWTFS